MTIRPGCKPARLARIVMMTMAPAIFAAAAQAEVVLAARTVRAQSVLGPDDLMLAAGSSPGVVTSLDDALGMETRVALFAGRPLRASDIARPALVERNQMVRLIFARGPLRIETQGRALGRGRRGEMLKVINATSRTTVEGEVQADGSILISGTTQTRSP